VSSRVAAIRVASSTRRRRRVRVSERVREWRGGGTDIIRSLPHSAHNVHTREEHAQSLSHSVARLLALLYSLCITTHKSE
jgi:hypothetical protein